MEMMYETIYRALVEAGLEGAFSPQDFLNFFCLGNREVDGFESSGIESPSTANTPQVTYTISQKTIFLVVQHHRTLFF